MAAAGTAEGPVWKIRKSHSFWQDDSLVVSIEEERFVRLYGHYLEKPGFMRKRAVDWYGVNYYSKEETAAILTQIRDDHPKDCETLLLWLEKAATEYNGFFFLGI